MSKSKVLFQIRLFLRKIIHRKNYLKLNEFLENNEDLKQFFNANSRHFNDMLCKSYGITGFNSNMSFECFKKDIDVITNKFSDILNNDLLLFSDDKISLYLSSRPRFISEGLFVIHLYYGSIRLYSLSFVLLSNSLLITALQGGLDTKEEIKNFTKEYFGLRPLNFIIFFAFKFAEFLGFNEVCGVKDKYLASGFKRNRNRNGRVYIIPNYDEIWQENTEIIKEDKYYYVLKFLHKDLEEIPSKKRSMYKKRYEFLKSIKL